MGRIVAAVLVLLVMTTAHAAAQPWGDINGDGEIIVVCLGNSNTQSTWQGFPGNTGWCEFVDAIAPGGGLPFSVNNRGIGGGMIQPTGILPDPPEDYIGQGAGFWALFDGHGQLSYALELLHPRRPDYAIAAFGTNDLRIGGGPTFPHTTTDPVDIVYWYEILRRRAAEEGIQLLIANTPGRVDEFWTAITDDPGGNSGPGSITQLNALIEAAFPPELIVDFRDLSASNLPMVPAIYQDRVHFSHNGQLFRAVEASLNLIHKVSSTRYEASFGPANTTDDGYERLGASLRLPNLAANRLLMARNQGHAVGLRLEVDPAAFDLSTLSTARLTLPVKGTISRVRDIEIQIELLGPDIPPFTVTAGDLSTRAALGSTTIELTTTVGMTELILEGPGLVALIDQAMSDSGWTQGAPNALGLRLSRVDSAGVTTTLDAIESGESASLALCFGTCS